MVVNIKTIWLKIGDTFTIDSVIGNGKRVYFYLVVLNPMMDTDFLDLSISFKDDFVEYYKIPPKLPYFKMESEEGVYSGKIYVRNHSLTKGYFLSYLEIIQS